MPDSDFWRLMAAGYLLTVIVETTVLVIGLSPRHPTRVRLAAGVWSSACTYPVVWLVLSPLFADPWMCVVVVETFASTAEAALFWAAFVQPRPTDRWATTRDMAVVEANVASYAVGELVYELVLG